MDVLQASNVSALANRRVAGSGGFIILAAGAHTGLNVEAIEITAASVITVYKEDETDKMGDRNLAAVNLVAGMYLPAPAGSVITDLTIDAMAIGYLKSS